MSEFVTKYRWWIAALFGVVLLIAGIAWATASDVSDAEPSLGLDPAGEEGGVSSPENGLVVDEDGRVITASNDGGAASGGSGTSGSGASSVPGGSDTEPPPPAEPGATMAVKLLFWNDTVESDAEGCQVYIAGASWSPGTSGDSDSGTLDGLAYDTPLEMTVLPNGSGGDIFTVNVTFTSVMEPGSEQDAIHVEVSDGAVRVIGNAVENFDVTFERS